MAAPIRNRAKPNHKFFVENGKQIMVEPVFYWGRSMGHGNYMAGRPSDSFNLLADSNGKPYPYDQINLPNWEN